MLLTENESSTSLFSTTSLGSSSSQSSLPSTLNKWLERVEDDKLYHFGLFKSDANLKKIFSDIKFVCTGGSASRLNAFAELFAKHTTTNITDNLSRTDRYAMWKTGPVLWVNHGMGVPSLSIMLIEVIKILHYAGATDFQFIRMGTSGGVGVSPGTVIVSSGAVNGLLEQNHTQYIQGKIVKRDAILDAELSQGLYDTAIELGLPVDRGLTMCADDFYEGQMRLDGLFCDYAAEDKLDFFKKLYRIGVKNIEMESTGFASYTNHAGIPAAILCVALVNRMETDQVVVDKGTYHDFEMRPFKIVLNYITKRLNGIL
ncbi:phosphorylase superfamily domain-containing protein [Ditylenchus destructor]|nr:phosphorylase superfamily domain-containing protein [Ditylenchus destructor]